MSLLELERVPAEVLSSYDRSGKTGGPREQLVPLASLGKAGWAAPWMVGGLQRLNAAVREAGGDLRVTECHRDILVQRQARSKYDTWVSAGKPRPGTATFNSKTMKAAFVAIPGRSGHNAGISIDIHVGMLRFPGVASNRQLDRLWELAQPIGWEPVIRQPDEGASESWHFDFWGELLPAKARVGYEQAALCGAILVGHGDLSGYDAELQAALVRAGFDIGKIDGIAGPKTRGAAMQALSLTSVDPILQKDPAILRKLMALPAR